tara:strand:- start:4570 stop:4989 length:420 start_codon:yes stop_codon:yes gene_type:complete
MHFVLFEDLYGENQQIHLDKILELLGVEPFTLSDLERQNKSQSKIPGVKGTSHLSKLLLKIRRKWYVRLVVGMLPKNLYLFLHNRLVQLADNAPVLSQKKGTELNRKFFNEDISKSRHCEKRICPHGYPNLKLRAYIIS